MWQALKLMFRWEVLEATGKLLMEVGDALEDNQLTDEERSRVYDALWNLVRVYRRR